MFVRVKTSPNTTKRAVQIVQNVRVGNKVRQHIVQHVGSAQSDEEVERLRVLAEFIRVGMETEKQPLLLEPESLVRPSKVERKEEPLEVNLKNLREERRVSVGIHEVYGRLFEDLGFNRSLENPRRQAVSGRNLFHLVMARIANPASKRASVADLAEHFGVELSLPSVYRMLDAVTDKVVKRVNRLAFDAAKRLLGDRTRVVFYDCTTLYFESFSEDELKRNGWSKDGKFNQPQVLLALLVSADGLPLGYEVYPGSTFEGHTLIDALERLKLSYKIEDLVVIADAAMLGKANIELLNERGISYVLGARLKSLPKDISELVSDTSAYAPTHDGDSVAQWDRGDAGRLIVSRSARRARKDRSDREKAVEKLRRKLLKSHSPLTLISNFGYKRFLKIEGRGRVELDERRLEAAAKWDGLHGIVTNIRDTSASELLEQYRGLWQIEDTFRVSKHDLRIRPIYHWTPERVRAHICLCFIALVCVRHLMWRTGLQGQPLSAERIRRALTGVQASILADAKTGRHYAIPSATPPEARTLYRLMGLKLSQTPFEITSDKAQ